MKHQSPTDIEIITCPVLQETTEQPMRLGMPHMNARGVSLNWLLRDCCHRHWWALARLLDCEPSNIRDESGTRAMASVVSAVISGRPSDFSEDDLVGIRQITAPHPTNGWRSETLLVSDRDAFLSVELVTTFAKRTGPSNRNLAPADMPESLHVGGAAPEARRARLLRAMANAARAAAVADERPPHLSFVVCPEAHMNGVGLMYFANYIDCFAQSERNVLPPLAQDMPLISREAHYFGNIDAEDFFDVHSEVGVTLLGASPRIETNSSARRRSDGTVIAVCKSVRAASRTDRPPESESA